MLDLILLGWIENTYVLFIAGMFITSVLEYFVSWLLESLFHQRWWDYTNWPVNIHGRVCVMAGAAFGALTVLLIRFIAPFTFRLIDNLGVIPLQIVTVVIASIMFADTVLSAKNVDTSKLWYVEKQSEMFAGLFENSSSEIVKRIRNSFRR